MRIRSEEHQDASSDITLQFEEETSQVSEGLFHIAILEVKLEFVPSKIRTENCRKYSLILDEVLINQLHSEQRSQLSVNYPHGRKGAARQNY